MQGGGTAPAIWLTQTQQSAVARQSGFLPGLLLRGAHTGDGVETLGQQLLSRS